MLVAADLHDYFCVYSTITSVRFAYLADVEITGTSENVLHYGTARL